MNGTKSASRLLPYPCLLSNTIPFASKMRCTFTEVCPEVVEGVEYYFYANVMWRKIVISITESG